MKSLAIAGIVMALMLTGGCAEKKETGDPHTGHDHAPGEHAVEADTADPHAGHEHATTAPVTEDDGYPLDVCVVTGAKLGSMGKPVVLEYEGRTVKFCCQGCVATFEKDPAKFLAKLDAAEKR